MNNEILKLQSVKLNEDVTLHKGSNVSFICKGGSHISLFLCESPNA